MPYVVIDDETGKVEEADDHGEACISKWAAAESGRSVRIEWRDDD